VLADEVTLPHERRRDIDVTVGGQCRTTCLQRLTLQLQVPLLPSELLPARSGLGGERLRRYRCGDHVVCAYDVLLGELQLALDELHADVVALQRELAFTGLLEVADGGDRAGAGEDGGCDERRGPQRAAPGQHTRTRHTPQRVAGLAFEVREELGARFVDVGHGSSSAFGVLRARRGRVVVGQSSKPTRMCSVAAAGGGGRLGLGLVGRSLVSWGLSWGLVSWELGDGVGTARRTELPREHRARPPQPPFDGARGRPALARQLLQCAPIQVPGRQELRCSRVHAREAPLQQRRARSGLACGALHRLVGAQRREGCAPEVLALEVQRDRAQPRRGLAREAPAPPVFDRAQPGLLDQVLRERPIPPAAPRDDAVELGDELPVEVDPVVFVHGGFAYEPDPREPRNPRTNSGTRTLAQT
jgi:hypothetical protein